MNIHLNRIIPFRILSYRRKKSSWKKLKNHCLYNATRFFEATYENMEQETRIGILTMAIHSIEKGFTMPNFRYGFGYKKLEKYLPECIQYVQMYGVDDVQIQHIAQVISDYKLIHSKAGEIIREDISKNIDIFLGYFSKIFSDTIQLDFTRESYFSEINKPFNLFSSSRHSCRNFIDAPIPLEDLIDSIKLAQNAPSACNRQPVRIYVVSDKEKIQSILSLQNGNRGFGNSIDKLVVVCSYLGCYSLLESECAYVDAGIFCMNLAYSLHYKSVGSCILNWCVDREKDLALRNIIPIRDTEFVCCFLACGLIPDNFKVCRSGKKNWESITTII